MFMDKKTACTDQAIDMFDQKRKQKKVFNSFFLIVVYIVFIARILSIVYSYLYTDVLFPDWALTMIQILSVLLKIISKSIAVSSIIYFSFNKNNPLLKKLFLTYSLIYLFEEFIKFFYDFLTGSIEGSEGLAVLTLLLDFVVVELLFITGLIFSYIFRKRENKTKYMLVTCIFPWLFITLYEVISTIVLDAYTLITNEQIVYFVIKCVELIFQYGIIPYMVSIFAIYTISAKSSKDSYKTENIQSKEKDGDKN